MSTSIHQHHPLKKEEDDVDQPIKESVAAESVMKYLAKCCDLESKEMDFSIDDIDEGSLALLVKLSQQESDDKEVHSEHGVDGEGNGDDYHVKKKYTLRKTFDIGTDEKLSSSQLSPQNAKTTGNNDPQKTVTKTNQLSTGMKKESKNSNVVDVDVEKLEPWQKALFDKLDKQEEVILDCQNQIKSLTNLISQDMRQRRLGNYINKNKSQNSEHQDEAQVKIPILNNVSRNADMLSPQENILNPNPNPNPENHQENQPRPIEPRVFLLTFLETLFNNIFYIPRQIMKYISTLRIVRLYYLIKHEAAHFLIPGRPGDALGGAPRHIRFLDWTLIMRLLVTSFFLHARIEAFDDQERRNHRGRGSNGGKKGSTNFELIWEEALELWRDSRTPIMIISTVTVYIIQTGIYKFLYHILVKQNLIKHVWNNEDLINNDNDNSNDNHAQRRRGRRDRDGNLINQNHANPEQVGDRNNNQANALEGQARRRGFGWIVDFINDTFIAGQIDRPVEHDGNVHVVPEQILLDRVIDHVKDVIYFFGSFFLSLFPMWHPRLREMANIPEVESVDETNVVADVDDNEVIDVD